MLALLRPSERTIARVLSSCAQRAPSHPLLADADLRAPPGGFHRDAYGVDLGHGDAVWRAARAALDAGAMYPPAWTSVHTPPGAHKPGAAFVSVIHHAGGYSILPGRVRETFDSSGPTRRYGFAFLTLRGHAEHGVERFAVSWDETSGVVRYDVTAISRAAGFARLAAPLVRRLQLRFQRDSMASMLRAVGPPQATSA